MMLHDFLESLYVSTNLENQKQYSPYLQAKTQAVHGLVGLQRWFYKWMSYPLILGHWLLVKTGALPAPLTTKQFGEKMKQDALDAQIAAQETRALVEAQQNIPATEN